MEEQQETTVVLADDHAIVREGIAALCVTNGMRILGQCADGASAVEMISICPP
jgi:DNA-binding NarL/FixJ family response regulator